jgi:hypothetical protein
MHPTIKVIIPDVKKRTPANKIWLPVSEILNSGYAIFTHGNALPHSTQQKRAPRLSHTGFCRLLFNLAIQLIPFQYML